MAAAELAECRGLQPSSDQAGKVHGFLSFPSCKMRILTTPDAWETLQSERSLTVISGKVGGGRPQPHCSLVQSGGAARSPEFPLPSPWWGL